MSSGWWELIFLMLLMKIPIVYLCGVVWWAVRAEPRPEEGAARLAQLEPDPPPLLGRFRARVPRPRSGPHGSPVRRPSPRVAPAARRELPRP
jgi:hypothetical protein